MLNHRLKDTKIKPEDIKKARYLLFKLEEQLLTIDEERMDIQLAFMTLRNWLRKKENEIL